MPGRLAREKTSKVYLPGRELLTGCRGVAASRLAASAARYIRSHVRDRRNSYMGSRTMQLNIRDMRPSSVTA